MIKLFDSEKTRTYGSRNVHLLSHRFTRKRRSYSLVQGIILGFMYDLDPAFDDRLPTFVVSAHQSKATASPRLGTCNCSAVEAPLADCVRRVEGKAASMILSEGIEITGPGYVWPRASHHLSDLPAAPTETLGMHVLPDLHSSKLRAKAATGISNISCLPQIAQGLEIAM